MMDNTKINELKQVKDCAAAAIDILMECRGVSGFGQFHTARPDAARPMQYTDISLEQINSAVRNPVSVDKADAQWAIFSTMNGPYARVHQYQRDNGQFFCLWADLDKVEGLTMLDVLSRIKSALPGIQHIIYSSRSAREDMPKCRVLIPVYGLIPGADYSTIAKIINDRLDAAGLPPDRASERPGQLCYLPNRGDFYQFHINDGQHLNPYQEFADEIMAEQSRLIKEQEERQLRHRAAIQKAQERISTGQVDPVEAYRQNYPVELALEQYGYAKCGTGKWLSPSSESGNPGVTIQNGKWYSHHSSDSGIGQPGKDGGTWGDAFDLFVYYEHGGDFNQAVQAAGNLFITLDPVTGQTVSINSRNQREYMRKQDTTGPESTNDSTRRAGGEKPDPWEPIIQLDEQDVEQIDPSTLPGVIGDYAQAVARETETPIELSAGMLFVAVAACVQGRVKITIKPGYSEPLAYWVFTPMPPATRKSQVLKRITAPLTEWERRKRVEWEPYIQARRIDRENTLSRIKALRGRYGKAKQDELKGIADEISALSGKLEPELVAPQIWAQDCTPENAGQIMARNEERLTMLAAEGGILDTIGGRYSAGVSNLDLFLQAYSGDSVKVNRTTREDISLNEPTLSMGLMPQPDVMRSMATKSEFKGRGFTGRPMYWMPVSNLGSRTLNSVPIPEHIKIAYEQTIEQLLGIKPIERQDGSTEPHALNLTNDAFNEWADFYMTIERDLADGGQFEHCRDWAGKTPGRAARLAGLLHCAMNPVEPWRYPVSLETMEQSLDLTIASISHALAIFNVMGADPAIDGAGRVLKWIIRGRKQTFTKKQVFDALRGTFKRTVMIDDPLAVLAERNYIRPVIESDKKPGRKSEKYEVNPSLWGGEHGLA